ncbi:MAG: hypothetical protein ACFE8U_15555 [Candidatus Hermodarchaeota archaeon]
MSKRKFRPISYLFLISFCILFLTISNSGLSSPVDYKNINQEDPPIANTMVNVTFKNSDTIYQRLTVLTSPELSGIAQEIFSYFAIAKLTTHADILFEFNIEFFSQYPDWNGNYSMFQNSSIVKDYQKRYRALEELVPVNSTLLKITSSSFETFQFNHTIEQTEEEIEIFGIHQVLIFRETTAFLLSLPEPFLFDLNKLELSQLSDFHFLHAFFNPGGVYTEIREEVRIKAPGSALEYVRSTKGYSGTVYLGNNPWDINEVPKYARYFGIIPQNIQLTLELPSGQDLSFDYDSTYKSSVSSEEQVSTKKGNKVTFFFSSDSKLPYYVKINSITPIWAQFTLAEIASMAFGALMGLITLLKGLPYLWGRRSYGKFVQSFHNAVEKGDHLSFEALQDKAWHDFIRGKLSSGKFEDVQTEINLLKTYLEKKPKEESDTTS